MTRRSPDSITKRLGALGLAAAFVGLLASCDSNPPTEGVDDEGSSTPQLAAHLNTVNLCFRNGSTPVEGVAILYDIDVDGAGADVATGPFDDPSLRTGFENFVTSTREAAPAGCVTFDVPAGQYSFIFAQFDGTLNGMATAEAAVLTATAGEAFISADPLDLVTGDFIPGMESGNRTPMVSERKGPNVSVTVLDPKSYDNSLKTAAFTFTSTGSSFTGDFNLNKEGSTLRVRFIDPEGNEVQGAVAAMIPTLNNQPHPWDVGTFPLQDGTKFGVQISWVAGMPALLTNLTPRETIALEGIFSSGPYQGLTFSRVVQAPRAGEIADLTVRMELLCCTRVLNDDEVAGDAPVGSTDILPPVQLKWLGLINDSGLLRPTDGDDGALAVVYDQDPNGANESTRAQFRARSASGSTNGHFDFTHTAGGDCEIVSSSGPLFTAGVLAGFDVSCRLNSDGTVEVAIRLLGIPSEFTEIDVNLAVQASEGDKWPNTAQSNDTRSDATIFRADACDLGQAFPDSRFSII